MTNNFNITVTKPKGVEVFVTVRIPKQAVCEKKCHCGRDFREKMCKCLDGM